MIQRVQTIYLLLVAVLSVLLCCFPFAEINGRYFGFSTHIVYAGVCLILALLPIINIFLFKRRILQMRIGSFTLVLNLLLLLFAVLYIYLEGGFQTESRMNLHWIACIPPINVILIYLAIRAIGKDEALVRSLDRIR